MSTALSPMISLVRAETVLLRRNRALSFSAVLLPVGLVALLRAVGGDRLGGPDGIAAAVSMLFGAQLLFVVYYTVLSTAVARREEGVLLRLRSGEARDGQVLAALCAPAVLVTGITTVLLVGLGRSVIDLPLPAQPLLVLLGVVAGCVVFSALGLATAIWTRSVESAQITNLPLVAVCVLGAGLAVPLEVLPTGLAAVLELTPLAPVLELLRAGWSGDVVAYDLVGAVGTVLAWAVVALALVASRFRWSARG
ncbi:ABC transporter permease [Kineococcus gynurae]|uniref:ABC transporter permease n=1 Tax=Kineococcus gynurae TaxID=452979 RepID=A0ABV5LNX5_9ACTN